MKLSYWRKILYASGSLGVALSYQAFGTYIQFLYIDILGLKASLVGIGWSVYGIWNAVNDPLAGYWSDNTKTRWGRRIPWIASTFIPVGLLFYLLWAPPSPLLSGDEKTPLFVYFMVVVLIFDLLWTIVVMNWTSLFPEMIADEKERATVSGWREAFSIIGLLVGVALPPILVGADWSGRGTMALWFALITSATFGISLLGSKENLAIQHEKQPSFVPAIKATFASLSFRWFMTANLFKEFIFSIMTASIPFWAKYVLKIQGPTTLFGAELSAELQNSLLLGSAFIMALPGVPIWTWVAKRWGGRGGWQMSQVTFALSILILFFANDFLQAVIGTSIVGLSLAGLLVFPNLLVADVIDEDETVVGARREGMYFGINGFIIRFAFSMQGITTGTILYLSRYISSTPDNLYPEQPAPAVLGIRAMTSIIPIIASVIAIWALQRYPLHSERLKAMREKIAAMRAQS
ncbi:MAG TPA: MFS transporter [Anaerolineales bacterium]|nr:MFS transporter [Anaerolineales bacterium]